MKTVPSELLTKESITELMHVAFRIMPLKFACAETQILYDSLQEHDRFVQGSDLYVRLTMSNKAYYWWQRLTYSGSQTRCVFQMLDPLLPEPYPHEP